MKKRAAIAVILSVTAVTAAAGLSAYSVMRGESSLKPGNMPGAAQQDDSGGREQWHHTPRLKKERPARYFQGRPIPEMREPPPSSASGFNKRTPEPADAPETTKQPGRATIGRGISEGHRESGPLPVRETIERARKLRREGKAAEAERLVKSAIMTETSPMARQLLQAELVPTTRTAEPDSPHGPTGPAEKK